MHMSSQSKRPKKNKALLQQRPTIRQLDALRSQILNQTSWRGKMIPRLQNLKARYLTASEILTSTKQLKAQYLTASETLVLGHENRCSRDLEQGEHQYFKDWVAYYKHYVKAITKLIT